VVDAAAAVLALPRENTHHSLKLIQLQARCPSCVLQQDNAAPNKAILSMTYLLAALMASQTAVHRLH
jgi:hypothetical protein